MEVELTLEGRTHKVVLEQDGDAWTATVDGHAMRLEPGEDGLVVVDGRAVRIEGVTDQHALIDAVRTPFAVGSLQGVAGAEIGGAAGNGQVRAPMTGRLVRIAVKPGEEVANGDLLFVLEAMKMQNEVRSPVAGTVRAVHGEAGEALEPESVVVEIDP